MMEHKQIANFEVKAVDDGEHGSFEAILSMPKLDRDGEVIDAFAFRPLPKSIPVFGDHVATIATTVGRGVPKYDDAGVLHLKGQFDADDYSQLVRSKLKSGSVQNMSVGFMAPERTTDKKGVSHIIKGELLEGSFVPIPSLREATVSLAKGITTDLAAAAKLDLDAETEIPDPEDRVAKAAEAAELLTQLAEQVLVSIDTDDSEMFELSVEALHDAFPQEAEGN